MPPCAPFAAVLVAGLAASACAASAPASGASWTAQRWAAQAVRDVAGGPFAFSAAPYGDDGFQFRLSLRTGTFGISSAQGAAPEDAQLRAAAENAAPTGCTLSSIARTPDGGALASYDCL